jgi:hypothetical protein
LIVLLALTTAGCAAPRSDRMPMSVRVMPNDCANRTIIINWLQQQAAIARHPLESQESYDQARRQIHHRIWTIRYNCQPV